MHLTKEEISNWFQGLQDNICKSLENLDGGGVFREDKWERKEGGGGRSRVMSGSLIEKGGVNWSAVHGPMPSKISQALGLGKTDFFATGVSIVLHPINPMMPIIHMNVRYFEAGDHTWWFGGGIDLTPHYVDVTDASFFHNHLKNTCDTHDSAYYSKFKKWADDYFFIKHRKETRGVGGIFFDQLKASDQHDKQARWNYVQDVGNSFVPIYTELARRNRDKKYDAAQVDWQKVRRGRYVEFNLVWDRGTKFGLDTDGRTESILMSMPPQANWIYDHQVEDGSEESFTQRHLVKDMDWINYNSTL